MVKLKLIFFLWAITLGIKMHAQEIKDLDKSPLDLAVFRPDGQGTMPAARIIYSRPSRNGRTMLGNKVPYGKVWRLGANQSTEINVYQHMTFGGKQLQAGDYTIYAVPTEKSWKIIFNSNLFTWGAYDYDASKNVLEIEIPVELAKQEREAFGMAFAGENGKGNLLIAWEKTEVVIPITY